MKIFITGASGFVGAHILYKLVEHNYKLACLVRSGKLQRSFNLDQVEIITGDLTLPGAWSQALQGCDAIVHLVAIIRENRRRNITFDKLIRQTTVDMVNYAGQYHVKKFIYISAIGADARVESPYWRAKGLAEQAVINSGLDYTIFRPSFIFGPDDAVFNMLASVIKRSPFGLFPVFGSGEYKHQPVSVYNVADAVAAALVNPASANKIYDIGGPEPLSWNRQLDIIGRCVNKKTAKIKIPLLLTKPLVAAAGILPFFPITSEQLKMLIQDNVTDNTRLLQDLDIALTPFEQGLKEYLH
ncbi:MAG TPA: NAD(P)H-binding protein [bacterium]|nr:NAD(P)H-binding protein [bacterium]HPN42802.1 NAD(P)H-binding protein [bacterium]